MTTEVGPRWNITDCPEGGKRRVATVPCGLPCQHLGSGVATCRTEGESVSIVLIQSLCYGSRRTRDTSPKTPGGPGSCVVGGYGGLHCPCGCESLQNYSGNYTLWTWRACSTNYLSSGACSHFGWDCSGVARGRGGLPACVLPHVLHQP